MNIISKFNKYFENKILFNKNKFKFNLGLGFFFCLFMLGYMNIFAYHTLFKSNSKISIHQPLMMQTNVGLNRIFPGFQIEYNGKIYFSSCKEIEIVNFCQIYSKSVEIMSINFYPMKMNPQKNKDFFFVYSMSFINKQGNIQHYTASPSFEKKHKIPLFAYIMIYGNLFMLGSCIYFTWLYHKVTKSYSIQN